MNKTFSPRQIYKTANSESKLILREYKMDLKSRFMEIKSINSKLPQKMEQFGNSD